MSGKSKKSKMRELLSALSLSMCAMCCCSCDAKEIAGSETFDVEQTASELVVKLYGKPTIVYQFTGGWKPYLREYRDANGINVIRDSPPDHPHHHGVMFAVR